MAFASFRIEFKNFINSIAKKISFVSAQTSSTIGSAPTSKITDCLMISYSIICSSGFYLPISFGGTLADGKECGRSCILGYESGKELYYIPDPCKWLSVRSRCSKNGVSVLRRRLVSRVF